jgi:hypothetical protein
LFYFTNHLKRAGYEHVIGRFSTYFEQVKQAHTNGEKPSSRYLWIGMLTKYTNSCKQYQFADNNFGHDTIDFYDVVECINCEMWINWKMLIP